MTNKYHSLEEIRLRKAELRSQLQKERGTISGMAHGLFQKEEEDAMPTRRFMGFVSRSASILDGAILAWKLYRRFRPDQKKLKSKKRRRFRLF